MVETPKIDASVESFLLDTLGSPDYEIVALAGDASSRRYFRVIHESQTMVLMCWEAFLPNGRYPFLNVLDHFRKHKVQVPAVVATSPEFGLVLLEDLGDLTLERKFWENQNQSTVLPFYKLAIDELVKIHYPATLDRASKCVAFEMNFDTDKLMWEMNYGLEHLLLKLCNVKLSDQAMADLKNIFLNICNTLDNQEKLICHRDYHSRNVMIHHNLARVIDFQDARMGPAQYDLVSLLHDSYVELSPTSRSELLEYYLLRAKEFRKAPVARDEFFQIYRYQILQRCFKACGSFASFFNSRKDTRYLKYLAPTLKRIENTLEEFPQYSLFLQIIRDNELVTRDFSRATYARSV